MYIFPDMIDMGLTEGQNWPSRAHKIVAQRVCLCNSLVTTRDALTEMVQCIIAIPKDKIKETTLNDLASTYHVPNVRLS